MPLANEFQEKQHQQAEQISAKLNPQNGPKEHPEDTLIVRNILVDDETEVIESIPYSNVKRDVARSDVFNFSQPDTHIYEHHWNTKDFFEVRWDGRPHRIKPGESRYMPRYLADHFAKNLIDFILNKREQNEHLTGLTKNRNARAELYSKIIEGVSSYYNGDTFGSSEGLRVERQVTQMNDSNAYDVGEVPNPAMGYNLSDKEPEKIEEPEAIVTNKHYSSTEEMLQDRSIGQLRSEAKKLGIDAKPNWSKEQLATAIINF